MNKIVLSISVFVGALAFWPKTVPVPQTTGPPSIIYQEPEKPTPPPPIRAKPKQEHPLIAAHNAIRKSHNLPPLRQDPELMAYAQNWAEHMARTHILRHQLIGGKAMGENIAMGQESIQELMSDWMKSSGHRANILRSSFTTIGVGIATTKDGAKFWCVDFGIGR